MAIVGASATPGRGPQARVRRRVLSAARELVETGGYTAFTVDALVAASGVSKTTVYRWWSNRAEVALDMLEESFAPPHEEADDLDPPALRLRRYLVAEIAYHDGPAGPILRGLFADSQHRPELAETLRCRYMEPRYRELEALLRSGVDHGSLREDLDASAAVPMLMAPLFQRLLGESAESRPEPGQRFVETIIRVLASDSSR